MALEGEVPDRTGGQWWCSQTLWGAEGVQQEEAKTSHGEGQAAILCCSRDPACGGTLVAPFPCSPAVTSMGVDIFFSLMRSGLLLLRARLQPLPRQAAPQAKPGRPLVSHLQSSAEMAPPQSPSAQ